MNYDIPESLSDERLDYVAELCYKLNAEIDEDGCGSLGAWISSFFARLKSETVKPPFTWQAFHDNRDIIDTLEGYGLDVEKFWLAVLFIYDVTMDKTLNLADYNRSQYDVLTEIDSYMEEHPDTRIYLSDDKGLPKDNRVETNSPAILGALHKFIKEKLSELEKYPEQKNWVDFSLDNGYNTQLSASYQQYFMCRAFQALFDALRLPEKRARQGDIVSYSKMLLISRLIYFCRLTRNEAFTVDSSSLKGIIKEYGGYDFPLIAKTYF